MDVVLIGPEAAEIEIGEEAGCILRQRFNERGPDRARLLPRDIFRNSCPAGPPLSGRFGGGVLLVEGIGAL